jgi:cellulose synthase/poly-beta-1,6-N-acetylglucosamine synthase-like glycosyltransferase
MTFFFSILGAALAAITLPLVLELALVTLASLLPRRSKRSHKPPCAAFHLAVVVPAHNEERLISRCVQSIRSSLLCNTTVLVIAHNCTDSTAEQARQAGAQVLVYDSPEAAGKGHALRYGFEHALAQHADGVLVIDADSTVSANLIPIVHQAMADGAQALQCRYEMRSVTSKPNTQLAALAFRGFNVIRPRGRSNLGLSAGIFGNGFALSRTTLSEIPYGAFSVVEDLEYHIHLITHGKRVEFIDEAMVSAELPESSEGENTQRSRWEGGRLNVARNWSGKLAKRVLSGQIRLLEPLLDVAGLPMAYAVFALLIAACLPVHWVRIYSLVSFAIVGIHVLAAAWAGPGFLRTLVLLAKAPLYVLWKLRLIPGVLRGSSSRAKWVRTDRNSEVPDRNPNLRSTP